MTFPRFAPVLAVLLLLPGFLSSPEALAAHEDAAFEPAEPIESVRPEYPSSARRSGITGLVVIQIDVDREGHVIAAEVERSSENEELDAAAQKAAWQWVFRPATQDGTPVESRLAIPFRFEVS